MRSVYNFVVKPKSGRHISKKEIDGTELILNTELQNHEYVSRIGIVTACPNPNNTNIKVGDKIIVHHNVFRRFYDIRGNEKNSKSYFDEDIFLVAPDQIFAKKTFDKWEPLVGFNFVAPIENNDKFSIEKEKPLVGVLKYKDPSILVLEENDIVGFKPGFEYEFIIDGQKLYRIPTNSITIKYEHQGDKKEYNPSWAQSS